LGKNLPSETTIKKECEKLIVWILYNYK
jgi:hypothetical protein